MTAPNIPLQPKSADAIRLQIAELVQQYANIAFAPASAKTKFENNNDVAIAVTEINLYLLIDFDIFIINPFINYKF